jgi:hypothetical protein
LKSIDQSSLSAVDWSLDCLLLLLLSIDLPAVDRSLDCLLLLLLIEDLSAVDRSLRCRSILSVNQYYCVACLSSYGATIIWMTGWISSSAMTITLIIIMNCTS